MLEFFLSIKYNLELFYPFRAYLELFYPLYNFVFVLPVRSRCWAGFTHPIKIVVNFTGTNLFQLEQMDLEVKSLPPDIRSKFFTRFRSYETELIRLEKEFVSNKHTTIWLHIYIITVSLG